LKLTKKIFLTIIKPFKKKTEDFYYRKKKFEDLNIDEVNNKINEFKKIFKTKHDIGVEKLSDKFFLIKKVK